MKDSSLSGGETNVDQLTWREQEVLILLAERLTNREIADRLHLAESTIKDYVGKIISKLYVKNRRQAVERGKTLGLLDPGVDSRSTPLTNLPAEPTPFIGRLDELVEIKQRLAETRLLTLTGPGGTGKTRLAIKAAEAAVCDFDDGCFLVALARISSVEHIVQTIAEALKFPIATHEDPGQQLLRYLRKRQLLLVLDNFEHLLDGAGFVNEILQTAPGVKVLTTSRERLNLQSETILTVGGMAIPGPSQDKETQNYDAVALFIQRATKVLPGFQPSQGELEKITSLCQIVQGMPLAIELAAAWLHILNLDEITAELKKGLGILSTRVRDIPKRHRSIQAVFDHSWTLLDKAEQQTFLLLSVFRGGFTRDAAQQVSGASLHQLAGLVNKSFLSRDPTSGRLEVHELLRQYAQELLGESPEAHNSAQETHAAYYATFMEQRWEHLKDHRQIKAFAEIEADIANVRTAWRFFLDQRNAPQLWQFIYPLWHIYWIRWWNHAGMELFAQAVQALQGIQDENIRALRAMAMAFQAYFMAWLDLADQGFKLAGEAVEILLQPKRPVPLVFAYDCLLLNAYFLNRYEEEAKAGQKMLEIAREMDDKWLLSFTLFAASMRALIQEDYVEARWLAESNLNLNIEIGDRIGSALPLLVLGHVALALGEYEDASSYYLRSLSTSLVTGFHYAIQTASKYLGKVSISLSRLGEAENYLLQSLRITREIGFVRDIINLFVEFARLKMAQDHTEDAVEILVLVLQHPASLETRLFEGHIKDIAKGLLTTLERQLPREIYKAALTRGSELALEDVASKLLGTTVVRSG